MLICCLGWGSLIWNIGNLPILDQWYKDGPILPIEFARQSSDDRITLVIIPSECEVFVRCYWCILSIKNLEEAIEALRLRERIPKKYITKYIGFWQNNHKSNNDTEERISSWGNIYHFDAVIWTNLPPKFNGKNGIIPDAGQVISHLNSLEGIKKKNAEHYIRMTPVQIATKYRQIIEEKLKWFPYSTT